MHKHRPIVKNGGWTGVAVFCVNRRCLWDPFDLPVPHYLACYGVQSHRSKGQAFTLWDSGGQK